MNYIPKYGYKALSFPLRNSIPPIIRNINLSHVSSNVSETQVEEIEVKQNHVPVLSQEIVEALRLKPHGRYLDMTFGSGGHTKLILEKAESCQVTGLDRDHFVKQFGEKVANSFPGRFTLLTGKFSDLPHLLDGNGIPPNYFDGVLMDLGTSSMQFDTPERGFMLSKDGPLDMRMDGVKYSESLTAADILTHIDEDSLYRVLKYYGQEKKARSIARTIVESRLLFKNLRTTQELAELVASVTGIGAHVDKLQRFAHPATKVFQALRILVNDELNQLDFGIQAAHRYLKPGGILAAISFHSLEDAILKRHFTGCELDETPHSIGGNLRKVRFSHMKTYSMEEISEDILRPPWIALTKHVVVPSDEEILRNPRSRSAKLRFASKEPDSRRH